jgi:hypothetical protein
MGFPAQSMTSSGSAWKLRCKMTPWGAMNRALDFDEGIPVSWLYIQSSRAPGGFDSAVIAKGAHLHQLSVVPRSAITKQAASDSENYRNNQEGWR